ncbi:MAG: pilus assembly protein PilM [Pseudobdellovibrio sp.]
MRAIGIDVGEDSVKVAEVIQNKKNVYVNAVFEKKLSQQASAHDKEIEAIEFIRQISQRLDTESAKVIVPLKQEKVTVRKKQFPFADKIKILKSLSYEMEEDIPFDPDLCLFEAKPILYDGFAAQVLAIAAPTSHIEKTLNLTHDFGFEPHAITVDGLAFANLLEQWDMPVPHYPADKSPLSILEDQESDPAVTGQSNNIQITLNIGHKKTLLCAQIENRVVFVRSILWGADVVTQELVRKFQLPYLEAQRLLQTKAYLPLSKVALDFDTANLVSTLEKPIKDLARDLQMTFLEIKSEFRGEIVSIDLTGGFSGLKGLAAFLTTQLEVATNTFTPIDQYLQYPGIETNNIPMDSIQNRFGTAVGIALEAFKKPRNPALQFLKGEFVQDNNKLKQFWSDWGVLVRTAAVALVVLFIWGNFRETFSTQLFEKGDEALKKQAKAVARLPKKQANEKGVKKYISENKKRMQEFKVLNQISGLNSALDVLKKVSEASPARDQAQIDLIEMQIVDDTVRMVGYANSPREVTLINQRLQAISLDKKVQDEQSQLPALPNKVSFALSFKADRGLIK